MLHVALGIVISLVVLWVAFVVVLAIARPKGVDLAEGARLVPDLIRLLRALNRDAETSRVVRVRVGLLLLYLASPIDLVPDFVPVLGYADDVVIASLVLRSIVRRAGIETIERHWTGTPVGLAIVKRLAGVR